VTASNSYVADPAALVQDSRTFETWRDDLDGMQRAIPLALDPMAFSTISGAQNVAIAFHEAALELHAFIGAGIVQFDGIARTLITSTLAYEEAEHASLADVEALKADLAAI
jgi:hypothetical protein